MTSNEVRDIFYNVSEATYQLHKAILEIMEKDEAAYNKTIIALAHVYENLNKIYKALIAKLEGGSNASTQEP